MDPEDFLVDIAMDTVVGDRDEKHADTDKRRSYGWIIGTMILAGVAVFVVVHLARTMAG